jgi:hypothetical protein
VDFGGSGSWGGSSSEDESYSTFAAVDGEGSVYAANNSAYSSSCSSSSAHDRASHLRLWALLEKRAGQNTVGAVYKLNPLDPTA